MSTRKNPAASKSVANFIKGVRVEMLRVTQEQLAAMLGVKRQAVVTWERGAPSGGEASLPSAENYIRLAKLTKEKFPAASIAFLGFAGLDDGLLRALAPGMDDAFRAHEKRLREHYGDAGYDSHWGIPLVEQLDLAGDHESVISQIRARARDAEAPAISFLKNYIPRPADTVCLLSQDDYMSPIFRASDVVCVDLSFAAPHGGLAELARRLLEGPAPIVAAYHQRTRGRTAANEVRSGIHFRTLVPEIAAAKSYRMFLTSEVGRQIFFSPAIFSALHVAPGTHVWPWTQKQEIESRRIDISEDPSWSIIGRVVAWTGSDPGARNDPRFRVQPLTPWPKDDPRKRG